MHPFYRKAFIGIAILDLIVTGMLVFPKTSKYILLVVGAIDHSFSLNDIDYHHYLFLSILGSLGVTWAVVRIISPSTKLVIADTCARFWISSTILIFVLQAKVSIGYLVFLPTELIGLVLGLIFSYWRFSQSLRA